MLKICSLMLNAMKRGPFYYAYYLHDECLENRNKKKNHSCGRYIWAMKLTWVVSTNDLDISSALPHSLKHKMSPVGCVQAM